jgi:formylglycine-generating enzyme required for sulfatase activity
MKRAALLVWSTPIVLGACGGAVDYLAPLGEVEIVVDTDMPVPRLVSRLRVDAYSEIEATPVRFPDSDPGPPRAPAIRRPWVESRDFLRASPADWPTSFTVYSPHPDRGGTMLVRLRAYLDGKIRDYRGERYVDAPPDGDPGARAPLVPGDTSWVLTDEKLHDRTPPTEPQPLLAVDRLVRVRIVPQIKQRVRIVLHGECVGVMADIAGARTCVDDPRARVAPDVPHEPRTADPLGPSAVGTFDAPEPCDLPTRGESRGPDGVRLFDGEVCVPKGVFIFGWPEFSFGYASQLGEPERMARVKAFRIDRNEVTVARWRQALREGFVPPTNAVAENNVPLPADEASLPSTEPDRTSQCTYSTTPMGRETYPLMCVTWSAARAFCRFYGGDLPYEAQWSYVAQAAMRPRNTAYPWGGPDSALAPCTRSVFGRGIPRDLVDADACLALGFGPQPIDAALGPEGDRSIGLGIENLGGSVSEWMRDDAAALDSICWMHNTLDIPHCDNPNGPAKEIRGGSWRSAPRGIAGGNRESGTRGGAQLDIGFRCVRGAGP